MIYIKKNNMAMSDNIISNDKSLTYKKKKDRFKFFNFKNCYKKTFCDLKIIYRPKGN